MTITYLLSQLFEARDQAHYWHLQTKNYAEHKALQQFYEGILELTDSLIEAYQGRYNYADGEITINITSYKENASQIYLKVLLQFLQSDARKLTYAIDTDINNILDEIQALTSQTIYMLNMK